MTVTQLKAAIQWWNRNGSFNLNHLEKVLIAKGQAEVLNSDNLKAIKEVDNG